MNFQAFNSKLAPKTPSSRSLSTVNLLKLPYAPKSSRLIQRQLEESKSQANLKKTSLDYLSLYYPKLDEKAQSTFEPKEQILETHQIHELLKDSESYRKV
jgi:hypothetical protein